MDDVNSTVASRLTTNEEDEEEDENMLSLFSAFDLNDDLSDGEKEGRKTEDEDEDVEYLSMEAAMQRIGSILQLAVSVPVLVPAIVSHNRHHSVATVKTAHDDDDDDDDDDESWIPTRINADSIKRQKDEMMAATTITITTDTTKTRTVQKPAGIEYELKYRHNLIVTYMGTMSLCRGKNGDMLRDAGAIDAALSLLHYTSRYNFLVYPPTTVTDINYYHSDRDYHHNHNQIQNDDRAKAERILMLYDLTLDVTSASLASLRDLACGNVLNRNAVGSFAITANLIHSDEHFCTMQQPFTNDTKPNKTTFTTPITTTIPKITDSCTCPCTCRTDGIDILLWYIHRYTSLTTDTPTPRNAYDTIPTTTSTEISQPSSSLPPTPTPTPTPTVLHHTTLHQHDNNLRTKKELRLFTNTLGVIRNISHSNRTNCLTLHRRGATKTLRTWLLRRCAGARSGGDGPRLPDASEPWREACYRTAGCLINMAEKCVECAVECSSAVATVEGGGGGYGEDYDCDGREELIWILMESWGGMEIYRHYCIEREEEDGCGDGSMALVKGAIPVLHLGLAAILKQRIASIQSTTCCRTSSDHVGHEKKTPAQTRGEGDGIEDFDWDQLQRQDTATAPTAEEVHGNNSDGSISHSSLRSQLPRQDKRLEKTIVYILNKEEERKRCAQEREHIRKLRQKKKQI